MPEGQDPKLHEEWKHPWVFDVYEQTRSLVAPILERLVQEPLSKHVTRGSQVLEVGAGGGALRRYAGTVGDRYDWIESDHNRNFLSLPRKHASWLMRIVLPDLSPSPQPVDAIVGMGVFDTLSLPTLQKTAEAAWYKLADDGVMLHWLDMAPDLNAEIHIAKERGLFPLPSNAAGGIGMHYLMLEGLTAKIQRLPIDQAAKNVFLALVTDPSSALPRTYRTPILPYLGDIAQENDLVYYSEPTIMAPLSQRLATTWQAAGFSIIKNEVVRKTGVRNQKALPQDERHVTHIFRSQGVINKETRPLRQGEAKGKVHVTADAHLFVARKEV